MQLEIKHVKGYLGTGCQSVVVSEYKFINGCKILFDSNYANVILRSDVYKLALRPLSDLTKEIEHNGESVNVYKILGSVYQFYIDAILKGEIPINYLPYECVQILQKYHFDIHNLIENNLAIDYNTLK